MAQGPAAAVRGGGLLVHQQLRGAATGFPLRGRLRSGAGPRHPQLRGGRAPAHLPEVPRHAGAPVGTGLGKVSGEAPQASHSAKLY